MKKIFAAILMMCLVLVGGCGSQQSQQKKTLDIGLMPDTDSLPFIIAREKGYFDEEGVKVELHSFKSAMDRDSALQSGNLDGAVSDVLAVAFAKSGGFAVKITSASDGSYQVIAGKSEPGADIKALAGKDVAVSRNTIIEYVTDRILEKEGMAEDSINKVVIPQIPNRLEMLQNGKIAAATLPEPMAGIAIHNGCHFLTSSDQLGINPGVIMFTEKSLEEKKESVLAMYRAYNKAVKYLNEAPRAEYIDLVVEKAGFPSGSQESLKIPHYHEAAIPKESDVTECIQWLREKSLLLEEYTYGNLVENLFAK